MHIPIATDMHTKAVMVLLVLSFPTYLPEKDLSNSFLLLLESTNGAAQKRMKTHGAVKVKYPPPTAGSMGYQSGVVVPIPVLVFDILMLVMKGKLPVKLRG